MGLTKEEQNKTLEELKNDYSQFKGISFNIDSVKAKVNEYLEKHNNPTKEDLVRTRNKFIAFEAVFSTRFPICDQPNGTKDPERFKSNLEPNTATELKYFLTLSTNKLADELSAYQIKYSQADDYSEFKTQMTDEYAIKNEKQDFAVEQYLFDHHGEAVFKGLFNVKTDGSLLPQEVPNKSGPEKYLYKEWQEQADKIVINNPPEKKLSDNLVKYVIMGEMLTDNNAKKILYGDNFNGSTPSTFFSDVNNLSVFLFDNAMRVNPDPRMNIHGFRKYVPEMRNEVNKKLAEDSIQPIKDNLRNCFNKLICETGNPSNLDNSIWYSQSKMLKEMVEITKGTDYDLNLSDIEKQKYDICMKKFDFLNEYRKSKEEMINIIHDYAESKGTNPQLDPLENPQLFEKLVKFETKNVMFESLNKESSEFSASILTQYPENIKNEKILNKPILPVERFFLTDTEKFEKDCRSFVLNSKNLSDLTKATTFDERLSMLHPGSNGHLGIGIKATTVVNEYADIYENEISALRFNEFKNQTIEVLNKVDTLQNTNEEKKELKGKLNNLCTAIDTVLKEREPIMKDFSREKLKELVPVYNNYYEKVNDVCRYIMDHAPKELGSYLNSCSREMSYTHNRGNDFEKSNDAYIHKLDFLIPPQKEEPKPEIVTLTEQALPEFISNLKLVSPETDEGPDSLVSNLEDLSSSLNLLRTSEKDSNKVSPVFSETAEKFMACKAKLNNILESGSTSAKFITGSFLKTMNNDEFIFEKAKSSEIKSNDALFEKRKAESLNAAEQKRRFDRITSDMDKVSSRFGGNSKEFTDMFKLAKKLNNSKLNREEHYKLVEKLQSATEEYISKKSTVPHTEKGKKRLELAKELRDLCRSDLSVKSKDLDVIMNKNEVTPYTQKEQINIRKQSCFNQMTKHIKNNEGTPASYKLSEFVYLNKLEKLADNGVDIKDKMSTKNINTVAEKLMPVTDNIIVNNTKKDLLAIINGENPQKNMLALFEKEKAPNVIDNIQTEPIEKKQTQISI